MSKYLFIAIFVMTVSYLRQKCHKLSMPWQQRVVRGFLVGIAISALLVALTFWQVQSGQRDEIDFVRLGWLILFLLGFGSISLLGGGPPRNLDTGAPSENPDHISPAQRVKNANASTAKTTRNK
ncbi:hypothetical protein [Parahaliea mediterranea]|uniref:Uncharacterized protein n=1 Tax=Parahaliea mediterranea TaxID=651086 RepID=A0A939DKJ4_9GAMM|nr:hypothetical protein [Parahaliea mediterranea]MBN7799192.1 hypothetical protein [Parahaliea mediterranea]